MQEKRFFNQLEPIRHFSRTMVRELGMLHPHSDELRLSSSHKHALIEIEAQEKLSSNELSERLLLDKSTVSRLISSLEKLGLIEVKSSTQDRRRKELSLSPQGRKAIAIIHQSANLQVQGALELLSEDERMLVQKGISLYSKALKQSRLGLSFQIRPIEKQDSPAVAQLIRTVMPEFGASGPGFAIQDAEVNEMYEAYHQKGARYFVILRDQKIVGGAGVAALAGGTADICELRKMYFLPEVRGLGYGQKLLSTCLQTAKELGYRYCYIETLKSMKQANILYRKNHFRELDHPMGNTGHFGCDAYYIKEL